MEAQSDVALAISPTERCEDLVAWYSNPRGRRVAPYLTARVTADCLRDWKITRR